MIVLHTGASHHQAVKLSIPCRLEPTKTAGGRVRDGGQRVSIMASSMAMYGSTYGVEADLTYI